MFNRLRSYIYINLTEIVTILVFGIALEFPHLSSKLRHAAGFDLI